MPRRKKKIRSIISSHTLNENVIICLPIKESDSKMVLNKNDLSIEENVMFTYNPKITTPCEQNSTFGENCERLQTQKRSTTKANEPE